MEQCSIVINYNELADDIKKDLIELIKNSTENQLKNELNKVENSDIYSLLKIARNRMNDLKFKDLKRKISNLIIDDCKKKPRRKGIIIDIPAIEGTYTKDFIFDKKIFLTGFHISMNGWKKEDTYNLLINKNKIVNKARTKEIGDHVYFNNNFRIKKDTPISFKFNNLSGNSRKIFLDLDFAEEITTEASIENIQNEWSYAVKLEWGKCDADLDLCCRYNYNTVCSFRNKNPLDGFYLNWDYTNHAQGTDPEICSINKNNGTLEVFINDYNGKTTNGEITISIYKNDNEIELLKTYKRHINTDSSIANVICIIDLNSGQVTDMNTTTNINNLR